MDIDGLHTFLEIIDTGSLVAASRRLHVTASTVTTRLATLEASVGQKLLHRRKSGVELTAAGFTLQRYAQAMVQLARQAEQSLRAAQGSAGVCNVGLCADLWRGLGDRFLAAAEHCAANVNVSLWPGEHSQLTRWLEIGLIDIAFDYLAHDSEACTSRVLFEDTLVMVSNTAKTDAQCDAHYVYVDHGDDFRRRHAEAFPDASEPRITLASSDWALEYLLQRATDACGYLPVRHAEAALAVGRLHRVTTAPVFRRTVHLIENPEATRRWPWYEAVLRASLPPSTP